MVYRNGKNDIPLIFELDTGTEAERVGSDIPGVNTPEKFIPERFLAEEPPDLPRVSEPVLVRHYVNLSRMNYGVDNGIYPLGSCTMKYNPKLGEYAASLPGFSQLHPLQPADSVEGALTLMGRLGEMLMDITGMDAITLMPSAGAHGEFTGISIIKKYFAEKGLKKKYIIIPDSAHGTNPATSSMCRFAVITLKSNDEGEIDLGELEAAMKMGDVAGLMLTNPNTLGLFDRHILEITKIVHEYGGIAYYDGANLNAMMGKCRPGDMGFDIVHINLHKTFSTPHGGGGPGSGPVGVKSFLEPYLPEPRIVKRNGKYILKNDSGHSIGAVKMFYGNFGVLVKAYAYISAMGADGLKRASEIAVLNANYLRIKLMKKYHLPFDRICMHEFVLSEKGLPNGVRTMDVAKRLLDYGVHAPTVYFPLIVRGAMMIEPTETESLDSLNGFAAAMLKIFDEASENPEVVKKAPHTTPIGRLDEVSANKHPVLTYDDIKKSGRFD